MEMQQEGTQATEEGLGLNPVSAGSQVDANMLMDVVLMLQRRLFSTYGVLVEHWNMYITNCEKMLEDLDTYKKEIIRRFGPDAIPVRPLRSIARPGEEWPGVTGGDIAAGNYYDTKVICRIVHTEYNYRCSVCASAERINELERMNLRLMSSIKSHMMVVDYCYDKIIRRHNAE